LVLAVGVTVVFLEALLWTVAMVELADRFTGSPVLGAIVGVLGYGLALHWSSGTFSVLVSSWVVLVLNSSYVLLRRSSRGVAIASTIAQKLAFLLYAAVGISTNGT
jgi:hypothetical protein